MEVLPASAVFESLVQVLVRSPCSMIHSVLSSRSDLSAKLSLPLTVRPPSAGGLTSRITSLPLAISTLSPAAGTFLFGQVAGFDQLVGLTDPALWACPANTPARRNAENSE